MPDGNTPAVAASRVRYIKLGQGGRHEAECFDQQIMRMGFGFGSARHFDLCSTGQWDALAERYKAEGRKQGKATENSNQARTFFEDDGSILWITFSRRLLWWAFIDGNVAAQPHEDRDGTFRPVRGQWRSIDTFDCTWMVSPGI